MHQPPKLAQIITAEALPDFKVRLRYADGLEVTVNFRPIIDRGGVFARLSDAAFFSQLGVDSRGRSICWPGEIDFCADALRQAASSSAAA